MFKDFKIIRQLKKLKRAPVSEDFLDLLRTELESYADSNPVKITNGAKLKNYFFAERSSFSLINKFRYIEVMPVPIIIVLIAALVGGGGVTMAAQNSLPGDALFTVKVLTEEVRIAFAFDAKSEANLQMKFAGRRVTELKDLFEKRGVDAKGIDIAIDRLSDNTARAAARIEVERRSGREMAVAAEQVDISLRSSAKSIGEVFGEQENMLESRIENLIRQFQGARAAGDTVKVGLFSGQLKDIQGLREKLYDRKEKTEKMLRGRERMVGQSLSPEQRADEDRTRAEEAILELERGRRGLLERAANSNVILTENGIKNIDDSISRAKTDLQAGRFQEAERRVEDSWQERRELEREIIDSILGEQRGESEIRGSEPESRGREQETRGREQEQEGRTQTQTQTRTQTRDRGQEQEARHELEDRGQEQELRGREQEAAETLTPTPSETRGSEAEQRGGFDDSSSRNSSGGEDSGGGRRGGSDDD